MELTKIEISGYVDSRLRDIVAADADERGIPLSEAVAQAIAKAYNRPDLAAVPRKRLGRPRKDATPVDTPKPKKKGKAK